MKDDFKNNALLKSLATIKHVDHGKTDKPALRFTPSGEAYLDSAKESEEISNIHNTAAGQSVATATQQIAAATLNAPVSTISFEQHKLKKGVNEGALGSGGMAAVDNSALVLK